MKFKSNPLKTSVIKFDSSVESIFFGESRNQKLKIITDEAHGINGIFVRKSTQKVKSLKSYFKKYLDPVAKGVIFASNEMILRSSSEIIVDYSFQIFYPFDPKIIENIMERLYKRYPFGIIHDTLKDLRDCILENLDDSYLSFLFIGFTYFFQGNLEKAKLNFSKSIENLDNYDIDPELLKHIQEEILPLCEPDKSDLENGSLKNLVPKFIFAPDKGLSNEYSIASKVISTANIFLDHISIINTKNVKSIEEIKHKITDLETNSVLLLITVGHSNENGIGLYENGSSKVLFTNKDLQGIVSNFSTVFLDFTCFSDHFKIAYETNKKYWVIYNLYNNFHNELAEFYMLGFAFGISLKMSFKKCHDMGNYCITFFSESERKLEIHEP